MFGKLLLFGTAVLFGFIGYKAKNCLFSVPELPKLKEEWWGPKGSTPSNEDTSIAPFTISISEEVLKDLKHRLDSARPLTPPLEGVQQQYGINANLLKEIVRFWRTKYDWRKREQFLNRYPQFTTDIQGLKIHFIHVKPKVTAGLEVRPLLLLHGWPGSVREFYNLIPLLTTSQKGDKFIFEVIVPSLPGYGFSQAATKPGLGSLEMAIIFKNLMQRIGFEKFYLHGGDWGSVIVTNMAVLYPDNILGVHATMCFANTPLSNLKYLLGSIYPPLVVDKEYEHRLYPMGDFFSYLLLEFGYMHLQATKPDTIGVALTDSPIGLAAYILEKFSTWTDDEWKNRQDGGLTLKYSYEDLLDNVMIYWVTNSITTSMRLYAETFNKAHYSLMVERMPTYVPFACAAFKNEIAYQPEHLLREKYVNLIQYSHLKDGGHFAAFEVPELLSKDIWSAVRAFDTQH